LLGRTDRKWRRAFVALPVVMALVLTACGSDKEKSGTGTTAPVDDIDPNGILKVGIDLALQNDASVVLDPAVATGPNGNPEDAIFNLLYGRFLQRNVDGTQTPDLAESAEVVDANTIEVVLREDLTFSDGSPLDADDVKASLERYLANRAQNETGFMEAFFGLKSIDVVSPTTVRLTIADGKAAGWYDAYIDAWQTSITKPNPSDPASPLGAGPMKLVDYERAQRLQLAKNDKFWDAKAIKLAGYDFIHISQSQGASGIAALRNDQVDVTFTEPAQLPSLTGTLKSFARVSPDLTVSMHICKREGPLADVKVRKAINKGINREAIAKVVFSDTAEPATHLWPEGHRFSDPALEDVLAYDPTAAKALLKEAGQEDGFSVDMYFLPNFGIPEMAEVVAQQLGAVGITVNLKPGNNYVNDFLVPGPPAIGLFPGSSAGVAKLNSWTGTSLGNVCKYSNPELDELVAKLNLVSQASDEAVTLWKQADKLVVDNALGGFLVYRSSLGAYDEDNVGKMSGLPQGSWIVPDPRTTYVKAK
jgi:glutathione transport system substrate-binding protein